MKKKIVSLLISLTMAIGLLSGCGSSSTSGGTTDAGAVSQTTDNLEEAVAAASSAKTAA